MTQRQERSGREADSEQRDAMPPDGPSSLEPEDWEAFRAYSHQWLDTMIDFLRDVRQRPVWQPTPEPVRERFRVALPVEGEGFEAAGAEVLRSILPYATGNIHPRFFGWVHGSGLPTGLVPEMAAAAMNANVGGREHGAVHVERQVIAWCQQIFGFPAGASGVLVSGTSVANLIGLAAARDAARHRLTQQGADDPWPRLAVYASSQAHNSVAKALHLLGFAPEALRVIPVRDDWSLDPRALAAACARDRANAIPGVAVVATAGTANTGAVDDLRAVADVCREFGLWMHVDGAFGALAILSGEFAPLLDGIERADSIAFDFHKWMHVNYDAACLLVRREEDHVRPFARRKEYLAGSERGLAAGEPWFCDFGPELSRPFRALKVWFALKQFGTRRIGAQITENCRQARYLADRVEREPHLELLAPVTLNIVCFRYVRPEMLGLPAARVDAINRQIVIAIQESGLAAPSATTVGGVAAVRVNLTNHRTVRADLDILADAVVRIGDQVWSQVG